jgi:hypothetical protein
VGQLIGVGPPLIGVGQPPTKVGVGGEVEIGRPMGLPINVALALFNHHKAAGLAGS